MFQTDTEQMLSAAQRLDNVRNEILGELTRYMSMNQDLGAGAFQGKASNASLRTTEDVATTGRQVSARFQGVIDHMKSSAAQYAGMNDDNAAKLGNISV
ncbi:WXG100 family type VII secretion target [Mycolicibacterium mageritense]|uniref:WXG100 family type VII secretion target n=1 Tax=Mycolicibacterium mageritense TaxID=53462 RepID=UPI001E60F8E0|nr:WXG100 family type VII secretion target [Mycolicibacterium mageritense]GJJ23616.1 hypothetical protein MTY414_72890 [Mycolicibacterium mageritense]